MVRYDTMIYNTPWVCSRPGLPNLPPVCPDTFPPKAELLMGWPVTSVEEAGRSGRELLRRGCGAAIITLGPQGCVVLAAQEPSTPAHHVPTAAVTAVDTTVRMSDMIDLWKIRVHVLVRSLIYSGGFLVDPCVFMNNLVIYVDHIQLGPK